MLERSWPAEGATRVPYWVYQDAEIYREEQRRIFHGPTWNYLCLEAELAEPGSFITTFVGDMPVGVTAEPTRRALQLHLSQLDLRPRRQSHQRRLPQGHRRQGRHAGGCASGIAGAEAIP